MNEEKQDSGYIGLSAIKEYANKCDDEQLKNWLESHLEHAERKHEVDLKTSKFHANAAVVNRLISELYKYTANEFIPSLENEGMIAQHETHQMHSIDWNQASKLGLLERINEEVLHPLGLAASRDIETGHSATIFIAPDGVFKYADNVQLAEVLSKKDIATKIDEMKKNKTNFRTTWFS